MPGFSTIARVSQRDATSAFSTGIYINTAITQDPATSPAATKIAGNPMVATPSGTALAARSRTGDFERGVKGKKDAGKDQEMRRGDRVGGRVGGKERGWIISACRVVFGW